MADAPDSKSGPRKRVWVQVPPSVVRICVVSLATQVSSHLQFFCTHWGNIAMTVPGAATSCPQFKRREWLVRYGRSDTNDKTRRPTSPRPIEHTHSTLPARAWKRFWTGTKPQRSYEPGCTIQRPSYLVAGVCRESSLSLGTPTRIGHTSTRMEISQRRLKGP